MTVFSFYIEGLNSCSVLPSPMSYSMSLIQITLASRMIFYFESVKGFAAMLTLTLPFSAEHCLVLLMAQLQPNFTAHLSSVVKWIQQLESDDADSMKWIAYFWDIDMMEYCVDCMERMCGQTMLLDRMLQQTKESGHASSMLLNLTAAMISHFFP